MSDPIYTSPTDISDVRRSLATAERNRSTLDSTVTTIQGAATTLAARVTALETANLTVLQTITNDNYVMAATDEVVIFKSLAAGKTCTLPGVVAAGGHLYWITNDGAGGFAVTVQCASGEVYGTDASTHNKYTLLANHGVTVFSDGAKWWVMAAYLATDNHAKTFA